MCITKMQLWVVICCDEFWYIMRCCSAGGPLHLCRVYHLTDMWIMQICTSSPGSRRTAIISGRTGGTSSKQMRRRPRKIVQLSWKPQWCRWYTCIQIIKTCNLHVHVYIYIRIYRIYIQPVQDNGYILFMILMFHTGSIHCVHLCTIWCMQLTGYAPKDVDGLPNYSDWQTLIASALLVYLWVRETQWRRLSSTGNEPWKDSW